MKTALVMAYGYESSHNPPFFVLRVKFEGYPEYQRPRFVTLSSLSEVNDLVEWMASRFEVEHFEYQPNLFVEYACDAPLTLAFDEKNLTRR